MDKRAKNRVGKFLISGTTRKNKESMQAFIGRFPTDEQIALSKKRHG